MIIEKSLTDLEWVKIIIFVGYVYKNWFKVLKVVSRCIYYT